MGFFTAIISLFVIVSLTLLINKIATVALTFTGMSRDMARFQARSAFSTCGFTTDESESVVNHPVRRKIIATLMLLGNAGFVSVIAMVLGTFTAENKDIPMLVRFAVLIGGLAGLWIVGMSKWIDDVMFRVIAWALKRFTSLEVHDFQELLHMGEGYSVTEVAIDADDWLVGQRLDELRLSEAGVNVLGIHRADGEYVGSPVGSTYLRKGDTLVIYGNRERIIALDEGKGDPQRGEAYRRLAEERRAQWRKEADRRGEGYAVTELVVKQQGWLAGKRLDELRLGDVGIIVLGIHRASGAYAGSPVGSTRLYGEDKMVVYGSQDNIVALDKSRGDPEGEEKHAQILAELRAERLKTEQDELTASTESGGASDE